MKDIQQENCKIKLTLTLPTREADWLMNQLDEFEPTFERQWVTTVEEFGPHCDLYSAYEKVTGRAKSSEFTLLGYKTQAKAFLEQLKASNHPSGVQWTYVVLDNCGVL